ncbi:hypothetical protein ACHAXR_006443 [Thalassiosira sp. AJA248-18]
MNTTDELSRKKAHLFSAQRKWVVILLIAGLNLPIIPTAKRWLGRGSITINRAFNGYSYATTGSQTVPSMKHIIKSENRTEEIPIYNYKRPKHAPPWPKVAWLMSFPNSGTSYTGQLVRRATQAASATNYGTSNLDQSGNSIPLFEWSPIGPFLTEIAYYGGSPKEVTSQKLSVPGDGSYILTKTHCGGTCFGCSPKYYLQTQEEFQEDCLMADYRIDGVKQKAIYDSSIISKAIHLVRDPFDNVVSRFHLKRNAMMHQENEAWLEAYPNTKKGFRDFCDHVNAKNGKREKQYPVNGTHGNVFLKYRDIPCYSDFIRYILWHNHAIQTIHKLQIESISLNYESYGISQNRTVDKLLNFLGLNFTCKVQEFRRGEGYRGHFEPDEVEGVKNLAEEISDEETWEMLERYFD